MALFFSRDKKGMSRYAIISNASHYHTILHELRASPNGVDDTCASATLNFKDSDLTSIRKLVKELEGRDNANDVISFISEHTTESIIPTDKLVINWSETTPNIKYTADLLCKLETLETGIKYRSSANTMPKQYYPFMYNNLQRLMPLTAFDTLLRIMPKNNISILNQRFELGLSHAYHVKLSNCQRIKEIASDLKVLIKLATPSTTSFEFLSKHADDVLDSISIAAITTGNTIGFQLSLFTRPSTLYDTITNGLWGLFM